MSLQNKYLLAMVWFASLLFIVVGIINQSLVFILIPLALLIYFFSFTSPTSFATTLLISTAISVPLSYFTKLPFDVFLPSELFLVTILLLLMVRLIQGKILHEILYHKITVAILAYLFWSLLVSLCSELPIVSLKATLVRTWYFAGFFLFPLTLFRQKAFSDNRWVTIFMITFSATIFYALFRHYYYGIWIKKIAYWAAYPFLPDHTAYGALLALFIPLLAVYAFSNLYSRKWRIGYFLLLVLFSIGLLFSYSRAAWLSLLAGMLFLFMVRLRLSIRTFGIIIFSGVIFISIASGTIISHLEQNQKTSSLELGEHFQSATNITSDISNLERINRWKSAFRMFQKRPFFGFGPGTYMFCYAPYQMSYDKTPISTNSGDLGNAHSEYLGHLSEMGIPGFVIFLTIIFLVIYRALKLLEFYKSSKEYWIILGTSSGLVTYFFHALVNNFLDIDKIALGFWGFIAVIVFYDLELKYPRTETLSPKA